MRQDHHTCPRRAEGPQYDVVGEDGWVTGRYGPDITTCTYCGSWSPDDFMAMLEAGELALGPTDKNYKVYLHESLEEGAVEAAKERWMESLYGQAMLKSGGIEAANSYWEANEAGLVSGKQLPGKFYFPHLSAEQQQRFIELMNEKKIQYTYPGHFYRMPFFVRVAP